jgi:PhnB protein
MKINAYLNFKGNCAAALKFYQKTLGAKVVFKMTYGQSPMCKEMPKKLHKQIIHARITVGQNILMLSDCPPDRYDAPKGITISINVDQPKEAEKLFAALSKKGKIHMPMAETFWAKRFAMFSDQFGIPWMINCEKKN